MHNTMYHFQTVSGLTAVATAECRNCIRHISSCIYSEIPLVAHEQLLQMSQHSSLPTQNHISVTDKYNVCTVSNTKLMALTAGLAVCHCKQYFAKRVHKLVKNSNKNLAIANRSHVSCTHNTLRAFIGLNITL